MRLTLSFLCFSCLNHFGKSRRQFESSHTKSAQVSTISRLVQRSHISCVNSSGSHQRQLITEFRHIVPDHLVVGVVQKQHLNLYVLVHQGATFFDQLFLACIQRGFDLAVEPQSVFALHVASGKVTRLANYSHIELRDVRHMAGGFNANDQRQADCDLGVVKCFQALGVDQAQVPNKLWQQ